MGENNAMCWVTNAKIWLDTATLLATSKNILRKVQTNECSATEFPQVAELLV